MSCPSKSVAQFSSHLVFAVTIVVASVNSFSQDANTAHTLRLNPDAEIPKASIDDFAWLQGYWVGEGLGGKCEEMWSAPMGDAILGTFRMLSDGKLAFTEFFVLTENDGQVSLKLKHFDPEFDGWEEKDKFVEFKLIKVEGTSAWFSGLTYELGEDGKLRAYVSMKKKDGSHSEGVFTFARAEEQDR